MINNKAEQLGNKLIKRYISDLLTDNDINLIKLIFTEKPTQEELSKFLETYDIEVVGGYKALMLSYFMHMHPELNFTKYENQRLKGLFNFFRFQNLKLMTYFVKIGKVFNKENIPMLLIKGSAIKYLRPELSRAMGDVDILVHEKNYMKTISIMKKMGYRLNIDVHSIDVHEPDSDAGILDIHRHINMTSRKAPLLNKGLFARAEERLYNGIKIFIPSKEDLLFLSLVNLAHNLQRKTSKASTLYVLFDCKYLLSKPDFDFNIVLEDIKLVKEEKDIAYAIKFVNTIIPNLIPEKLSKHRILKNCVNDNCMQILFNEIYFKALQRLSRKTKFKDIKENNISLKKYLSLKLHYKYCKFLSKRNLQYLKVLVLDKRQQTKSN